jgi:hypothetical protein
MATTTGRTGTRTMTGRATGFKTRKANELLVITRRCDEALANLTNQLARNNINIECFTSYEWGNEAAFRMVTDNNKKARELLSGQGYTVQENPVTLWYTENTPGWFNKAATALARAHIDTFATYMTAQPDMNTTVVAFTTNDTTRTMELLSNLR